MSGELFIAGGVTNGTVDDPTRTYGAPEGNEIWVPATVTAPPGLKVYEPMMI